MNLGKRIREDNNLERSEIYGEKILQGLAESISTSERTIYYALQLFDKYPILDALPEGKNITWKKLITKYLPAPKEEPNILEPIEGKYDLIIIDPPWPLSNYEVVEEVIFGM